MTYLAVISRYNYSSYLHNCIGSKLKCTKTRNPEICFGPIKKRKVINEITKHKTPH